MIEFIFTANKHIKEPIYVQLYNYLKKEILSGNIKKGEKMPSIRMLSSSLFISKTTIITAYEQLIAEGYIEAIEKSGYYVSEIDKYIEISNNYNFSQINENKGNSKFIDLKNESIEKEAFNFLIWKKCLNKVLTNNQEHLIKPSEKQGELFLRIEIAKYIYQKRGVSTNPQNIIIGAGAQTLLNILTPILNYKSIDTCVVEDPGFNRAKDIFKHNNIKLEYIHIHENGMNPDMLQADGSVIFYLNPNNQFPTGKVMPISERIQLLQWAYHNQSYIIEDDYNSELRFPGRPIQSMKSLDTKGIVIYLGSFSSLLAPFIRLSYMVLPDTLLNIYSKICTIYMQTVSAAEQHTLAYFFNEGHFERHIKKIRKMYSKKRKYIEDKVNSLLHKRAEIINGEIGMHLLIKFNSVKSEKSILYDLEKQDIQIASLSEYSEKKNTHEKKIFLIYFAGLSYKEIDTSIEIIASTL